MGFIKEKILVGEIIILDVIANEILQGYGWEAEWIKTISSKYFIKRDSNAIVLQYSKVLETLNVSPFFNETALRAWSEAKTADPWLIAACLANGYTLVTLEKSTAPLDERSPISKPKIPQVCSLVGVECIDTFSMLRQLRFCFK